jgi:hypothetical protein
MELRTTCPRGSSGRPTVCRIIRNFLECSTVYDPQMPSIPALDNAARSQASKCSAHGFKRHSKVFADVRPVHREIYLCRVFTSGDLKLFEQLKEHRHLEKGLPARKDKRVTLCLTEFLAELADNMKFQAGIFR